MFPAPEARLIPYITYLNLNVTLDLYEINPTIAMIRTVTEFMQIEPTFL